MEFEFYVKNNQKISELITELIQKGVKYANIMLEPKVYEDSFSLPSGFNIIGCDKNLTKIIILDKINIHIGSSIKNLTLEFSNFDLTQNIELISINTELLDLNEDLSILEVLLENLNIKLYNFISGTVFNLDSGILNLKNVSLQNKINEELDETVFYNNIVLI